MSENVRALIRRLEENLVAAADDADLRSRLAEAYQRVGDTKSAGQQFKEIGRLRLERMQVQRGAEALKRAAEFLPNDLTIQEQLYTIYRLTARHEDSVQVGTTLADQLRRARQFGRAEEILMRCLQVGGDRPDVRRVLAETYAAMGAADKARPHLQHLATHHPDEREKRRAAQMLADLERKSAKQESAEPNANAAKSRGAARRAGRTGVRLAWLAVGLAAAAVCGAGINRHVGAQRRAAAVAEASALAAGGDLAAAAAHLRESGLEAEAAQADRAATIARGHLERAELTVARDQGLAPGPDGGPSGFAVAQRLKREAEDAAVRAAAEGLVETLERAAGDAERLQRTLDAGDTYGAFSAWRALRDGGHLPGVLAATPGLAAREVVIELSSVPLGAVVSDGARELGVTPCKVGFPIGAGRIVTVTAGELSARVDCRETPGAKWELTLQRAERWRVRLAGAITGAAVAGARTYAGGADGELVCVDSEGGHEHWRVALGPGGDVAGAPVVAGSWVVVMLGSGRTAAFTRADGTRGGPLDGLVTAVPPVALEGGLLLAQPDGALVRVPADGGAAQPWGRFAGVQQLAVHGDVVYAVGESNIAAFPAGGGATRWTRDMGEPLGPGLQAAGPWLLVPRRDGGVVVLETNGSRVEAGQWTDGASGPAIFGGTRVLFGRTVGGVGEAVPALPGQDNPALKLPPEAGTVRGLTLGQGVCYVATGDGRLTAWVPAERTPRWSAELGATASTSPVVDGGRVLLGLHSGVLVALAGEAP